MSKITLTLIVIMLMIISFKTISVEDSQEFRRFRRKVDLSKIDGSPQLLNCATKDQFKKHPLFVNTSFSLFVTWDVSDVKDKKKSPKPIDYDEILSHYDIQFRFVEKFWSKDRGNYDVPKDDLGKKFRLTYTKAVIPPYALAPGEYKFYPKITPKDKRLRPVTRNNQHDVCWVVVSGLPPQAVITGGSERSVPAGTAIEITGEESLNLNYEKRTNKQLKFSWTCTQKTNPPTFCKPKIISNKMKFKIPVQYITNGEEFKIKLEVVNSIKASNSASQTITVMGPTFSDLRIICEKNCPPAAQIPDITSATFLRVKCITNCEKISPNQYEWDIKTNQPSFNFNFERDTDFGKNGEKFSIKRDVLKEGTYSVSVQLKDTSSYKGLTKISLTFVGPPTDVTNCKIIPPQGQTLITYFQLKCVQKSTSDYRYELYAIDKKDSSQEQLIIEYEYPGDYLEHTFQLPESNSYNYVVRISVGRGPATEIAINAKVTSSLSNKSPKVTVNKIQEIYNGKGKPEESITNLIISSDPQLREKGLQKFHAMVDELVDNKAQDSQIKDLINDLKYQTVEDMLNAPISSEEEIIRMGDSISRLMSKNELNKSDPLLAKFTTTICKKMIAKHLDNIKKEEYPRTLSDKSKKVAASITRCLETNSNPNYDILKHIEQNITTEAPSPDVQEPNIEENYENYKDFDDNYYKNIENFAETTYNIINATAMSAKVLAMTTVPGEKFIETSGKKSSTKIAKDEGKILAKSKLILDGVTLIPSQDFADENNSVDILMSAWYKDMMWWNTNHTKVSTPIVNTEVWYSSYESKVPSFKKPAKLFLRIGDKLTKPELIHDDFNCPEGYANIADDDLNRLIKVWRVTLPRRRRLRVHFYNLKESDVLDVVITELKFPTIEDFRSFTKITNKSSFIWYPNKNNYDIWTYIGILPNQDCQKTIKYTMSFTVSCCIHWVPVKSFWKPACMPGGGANRTTISCECHHLDIIAGYVQNIEAVPQILAPAELELELEAHYIIFVTVATILGIYSISLIFIGYKRKPPIYFLADNLRDRRFAYLAEVKTGSGCNTGTTSNVMMRVIGAKSSSDIHLLNYPDPGQRILQRFCEDVFIFTTKHHLGKLTKIKLWTDFIGVSPSWYCHHVKIYDLQEQSEYYFKIKRWLSLIKNYEISISVPPLKTKHIFRKMRCCNKLHTWCLFFKEDEVSNIKKVTLILSNILMIFTMVVLCLGVPAMELKDSLDYMEFKMSYYEILVTFGSSLSSFIIHIAIIWGLRFSVISEKKQLRYKRIFWLVLMIIFVTSLTFLIIYGFWVPFHKSLVWLSCSFLGIFVEILFYENMFIMIQSFLFKYKPTNHLWEKFDDIWKIIEIQRTFLYKHLGDLLLRPYFTHLYKPLEPKEIKKKKMVIEQRRQVISELEDLIMFGIYFFILYVVILANKDHYIIKSKQEFEQLLDGKHTRTQRFSSVSTVPDLYKYINQTLIPAIQPLRWYGNYVISDPGLMVDVNNKYIGVVRFRQHRLIANICQVAKPMKFLNISCWPEYSWEYTETQAFGYGWGKFKPYLQYDRLNHIWEYSTAEETGTMEIFGQISEYTGGGYVSYLGRTLYNSFANFRTMISKYWFDQKTRSVFIEFLAYNANYNVFTSAMLLFEQSAAGWASATLTIFPARMIFIKSELQIITTIFFFLFVIWVGLLFMKYSIGLLKNIRTFYRDFWFLIDILIITMSIICIVIFFLRMLMIGNYLYTLEKVKHNEFTNYFYLFYIEDFLSAFAAALVCIATVRLWKFLRFGLMFRIMEKTLSISIRPLCSITLIFILIVFNFACTGVLLYGNQFKKIHSIFRLMRELFTVCLKPTDLKMNRFGHFFASAYFYFSLYLIIVQIMLCIYISVIILAHENAKLELSNEIVTYNIKSYIEEQMDYIPRYIKYKCKVHLKGGDEKEEDEKLVEPKSNDFLYENCFSTDANQMVNMVLVTRCVFRNLTNFSKNESKLADYDLSLMTQVCCRMVFKRGAKQGTEIFYKGRVAGEKITLVDQYRLIKVAHATKLILKKRHKRKRGTPVDSKHNQIKQCIKDNNETLKKCVLLLKLISFKIDNIDVDLNKIQ